jgi:hypothetical protein
MNGCRIQDQMPTYQSLRMLENRLDTLANCRALRTPRFRELTDLGDHLKTGHT